MKKVLYGLWAVSALTATSVYAAPAQVGKAAGSIAASVSTGSPFATSASAISSTVGVALAAAGDGDGPNIGIIATTVTSTQ